MMPRRAPHLLLSGLLAGLVLTACNRGETEATFNGQLFLSESETLGEDLRDFSVVVSPVAGVLEGARQAGQYEGTRYCIENYGTSQINWIVGPETDAAQLRIVDNTLTFQGRCNPR